LFFFVLKVHGNVGNFNLLFLFCLLTRVAFADGLSVDGRELDFLLVLLDRRSRNFGLQDGKGVLEGVVVDRVQIEQGRKGFEERINLRLFLAVHVEARKVGRRESRLLFLLNHRTVYFPVVGDVDHVV
jgi:hypothetical protein